MNILGFKLKYSYTTYPNSNAKSLALTCTKSDNCPMEPMAMIYTYIRIATVGNTIQTVNSPMYDTSTSTPCNTAKPRAIHSKIQTAQSSPSLVGSEPTMHLSAHHWVSALAHYASVQYCQSILRVVNIIRATLCHLNFKCITRVT